MSIFSGDSLVGGQSLAKERTLGECKRDYEREIERLKSDIQSTKALFDALNIYLDFHGKYYNQQVAWTLPSLYGMLALEIRSGDQTLKAVQDEWQREIDRLEGRK